MKNQNTFETLRIFQRSCRAKIAFHSHWQCSGNFNWPIWKKNFFPCSQQTKSEVRVECFLKISLLYLNFFHGTPYQLHRWLLIKSVSGYSRTCYASSSNYSRVFNIVILFLSNLNGLAPIRATFLWTRVQNKPRQSSFCLKPYLISIV